MPEPVSLRHGRLSAAIDPMGAQLLSLKLDGHEYLWQGDPRFWARRAPVLFPIVGSLRDGRAESAQGPCVMGRHGIARNYEHAESTAPPMGHRSPSSCAILPRRAPHIRMVSS